MWTTEEAQRALSLCDDPILLLAMLLALGCSMRIGEILGLTWDCVDISESSTADGTACVLVNKELKRCDKTSLADLQRRGRSDVRFVFPERKQTASSTSLVLKEPKTASSVRKVFLPKTVREGCPRGEDCPLGAGKGPSGRSLPGLQPCSRSRRWTAL